jgi:hypothetical protein
MAWLAEVGIIGVRSLTASRRFPLPSELLATFVVFGGLSVVATSSTFRGAAGATAWGLVIATLVASKVDVLRPVGDFLGGQSVERADPNKNLPANPGWATLPIVGSSGGMGPSGPSSRPGGLLP